MIPWISDHRSPAIKEAPVQSVLIVRLLQLLHHLGHVHKGVIIDLEHVLELKGPVHQHHGPHHFIRQRAERVVQGQDQQVPVDLLLVLDPPGGLRVQVLGPQDEVVLHVHVQVPLGLQERLPGRLAPLEVLGGADDHDGQEGAVQLGVFAVGLELGEVLVARGLAPALLVGEGDGVALVVAVEVAEGEEDEPDDQGGQDVGRPHGAKSSY